MNNNIDEKIKLLNDALHSNMLNSKPPQLCLTIFENIITKKTDTQKNFSCIQDETKYFSASAHSQSHENLEKETKELKEIDAKDAENDDAIEITSISFPWNIFMDLPNTNNLDDERTDF